MPCSHSPAPQREWILTLSTTKSVFSQCFFYRILWDPGLYCVLPAVLFITFLLRHTFLPKHESRWWFRRWARRRGKLSEERLEAAGTIRSCRRGSVRCIDAIFIIFKHLDYVCLVFINLLLFKLSIMYVLWLPLLSWHISYLFLISILSVHKKERKSRITKE